MLNFSKFLESWKQIIKAVKTGDWKPLFVFAVLLVIGVIYYASISLFRSASPSQSTEFAQKKGEGNMQLSHSDSNTIINNYGNLNIIQTSPTSTPIETSTSADGLSAKESFTILQPDFRSFTTSTQFKPEVFAVVTKPSEKRGDSLYYTEFVFALATFPGVNPPDLKAIVPLPGEFKCGSHSYAGAGTVIKGPLIGKIAHMYRIECTSQNPFTRESSYSFEVGYSYWHE